MNLNLKPEALDKVNNLATVLPREAILLRSSSAHLH